MRNIILYIGDGQTLTIRCVEASKIDQTVFVNDTNVWMLNKEDWLLFTQARGNSDKLKKLFEKSLKVASLQKQLDTI